MGNFIPTPNTNFEQMRKGMKSEKAFRYSQDIDEPKTDIIFLAQNCTIPVKPTPNNGNEGGMTC